MAIMPATMTAQNLNVEGFRADLLAWYDSHRRVMPWRALAGQTPNPYHVWLSEVMLQQTTVQAVVSYFLKFIEKWPTVGDLAAASNDDIMQNWAGLGYYARARNLHKCAKYVAFELQGVFPQNIGDLKQLPGVGDYTANAIAAIAFNQPANVVDGNVERVMVRIFNISAPMPASKPELKALAGRAAAGESSRPGDYAQALMDLGATICIPGTPRCALCPVQSHCVAKKAGTAAQLPARAAKPEKPQKHGYVYWVTDAKGQVLFEKRPEKGMLAGMIGLPTSEWSEKTIEKTHLPFRLFPKQTNIKVRHSFTHFDLELEGHRATLGKSSVDAFDKEYFWVTMEDVEKLGIPTLFKKALRQFIKP